MANLLRYCLGLCVALPLYSADLGTCGKVFPIKEDDLLVYLKEQITEKGIEKLKEFQEESISKVKQPKAVSGLNEALEYREFTFDPSFVVMKDIEDHQGKIIAAKGTVINPLKQVDLGQELLFFNGDDKNHVAFARTQKDNTKWILVKGNPFQLEEDEQYPVYFDQAGVLVKWLGIKRVPSRVYQDGSVLRIEEIPVCK